MSTRQVEILRVMGRDPNKYYTASDMSRFGIEGSLATIGASMKFLVKSGHLKVIARGNHNRSTSYLLVRVVQGVDKLGV